MGKLLSKLAEDIQENGLHEVILELQGVSCYDQYDDFKSLSKEDKEIIDAFLSVARDYGAYLTEGAAKLDELFIK